MKIKFSLGKIWRVYIGEWHGFLNYVFVIYTFILQTKVGFLIAKKKRGAWFFGGWKKCKNITKWQLNFPGGKLYIQRNNMVSSTVAKIHMIYRKKPWFLYFLVMIFSIIFQGQEVLLVEIKKAWFLIFNSPLFTPSLPPVYELNL